MPPVDRAPTKTDTPLRDWMYELRDRGRAVVPRIAGLNGLVGWVDRLRRCAWSRIGGELALVPKDGRYHAAGLMTCGNVNSCAGCAYKVHTARRKEVVAIATAWQREYPLGGVVMLTPTVRHQYGDELNAQIRGEHKAWSDFAHGSPWERFKEAIGAKIHRMRWENGHGGNGWHHHGHCAFFVTDLSLLDGATIDGIHVREWANERWRARAVAALGPGATTNEHGVDIRTLSCAGYVEKIGFELSDSGTKRGRGTSRTPWQILEDLTNPVSVHDERSPEDIEAARQEDLYLWHTWVEDSRHHRMLSWSRDQFTREFRKRHGVEEKTDEEILDETAPADGETIVVPGKVWDRIRYAWFNMLLSLVHAAERGGKPAVDALVAKALEVVDRRTVAARAAAEVHASARAGPCGEAAAFEAAHAAE